MTESWDVHRDLGRLIAQVEGLRADFDKAERTRHALHRRIDDVVDENGAVRQDVGTMKSEVANTVERTDDTQTVTDEVKRWKAMGMGALAMVGIGSAGIGAAILKLFEAIVEN